MKIEIQAADRVAVAIEGKVIKAKVMGVEGSLIFVLAGSDIVSFDRSEVLPLYRYNEDKSQVIPFVLLPAEKL